MSCYIDLNNVTPELGLFAMVLGKDYSNCIFTPEFIYVHLTNRQPRWRGNSRISIGKIRKFLYKQTEGERVLYTYYGSGFFHAGPRYYRLEYIEELGKNYYNTEVYKAIKQIVLGFPFGQVFTVKTVYKHIGRFIGWWYAKKFKYDYIRKALDELCEEGKLKTYKNGERYTLLRRY